MSLQMFSSFIEKAIKNISKCARRNEQKCVIPRDVFLQYAAPACRKTSKPIAVKAADHAEVSTTDFSDDLGQAPGSPDSSDTDTSIKKMVKMKMIQAALSEMATSPRRVPTKASTGNGLKGPPGLASPLGLDELLYPPEGHPLRGQRQPLNAGASLFVPSFAAAAAPAMDANREKSQQVRNSIRMLKDALQDWESGFDGPPQQNDLSGLQDALSRLTPQEAAMISGLLEAKEMQPMQPMQASPPYQGMMQPPAASQFDHAQPVYGQPPPASMDLGWMRAAAPPAWAPAATQRPFTPVAAFAGSSQFSTAIGAARQQPKRRKPELSSTGNGESLSTHLRDLALLDSARILMVRKINHLGENRISAIQEYFAKFGTVDRVLASPTRASAGRVRPPTVGFMVMGTAEEAQAVLAHGPEHAIQGVTVLTGTFQSHPIEEPAANKEIVIR